MEEQHEWPVTGLDHVEASTVCGNQAVPPEVVVTVVHRTVGASLNCA
jgi:hypothetical protein